MNFIFLDIDGVLNNKRHYDRLLARGKPPVPPEARWLYRDLRAIPIGHFFDPDCMAALNFLVTNVKAEVVVSSSWRDWKLPELHAHFKWQGYAGHKFYSRTPYQGHWSPGGHMYAWHRRHVFPGPEPGILWRSKPRGIEIQEWIDKLGAGRCGAFVILDDDPSSAFAPVETHLVRTDNEVGLTMDDARRAVQMLGQSLLF